MLLEKKCVLVFVALFGFGSSIATANDNITRSWSVASLQAVRDSKLGPPMVARALAIVHTCMYDAWAAYDNKAVGTELGGSLRRPARERRPENIEKAVSFAAYRAAVDLFPGDKIAVFDPLMESLGYDPNETATDVTTPAGVGNVSCAAVLSARHHDGSNQFGDLTPNHVPYSDWTGYIPSNPPSTVPVSWATVADPNRWQPLQYTDATGTFVTQGFLAAQWYRVTPFALSSPSELRSFIASFGPAIYGTQAFVDQAKELIDLSANLTDKQKMIAEYWKDGPHSETPPGHWCLLAQFVSERDHHSLEQDIKMYFILTNALFDASIAAWDAKRAFDSVRPATAIPYLFHGRQIRSWGGPNQGTITMDAANWIPYQPGDFPTPPFPEYISGHSTFSAAGATVLALFTHSDRFGDSVTFPPGSSLVEPGTVPSSPVTLNWKTFSDAADEAGISRRYGGIHFKRADLVGRATGRLVGLKAFEHAQALFNGKK